MKREFDKELTEATKNDAQAWLDARVGTLKEASANPAEFHRVWKQLVVRGRKPASGRGRYFSSTTEAAARTLESEADVWARSQAAKYTRARLGEAAEDSADWEPLLDTRGQELPAEVVEAVLDSTKEDKATRADGCTVTLYLRSPTA